MARPTRAVRFSAGGDEDNAVYLCDGQVGVTCSACMEPRIPDQQGYDTLIVLLSDPAVPDDIIRDAVADYLVLQPARIAQEADE